MKNKLTSALLIRLAADDAALLDAVSARLPVLSRAAIAREAMRIGLRQISNDPGCLIAPIPATHPSPRSLPATLEVIPEPTTEATASTPPDREVAERTEVAELTKATPRPKAPRSKRPKM